MKIIIYGAFAFFLFITAAFANSISTKVFVYKASVANLFEISSSEIAIKKSHQKQVKRFASNMIEDHKEMGSHLKDVLESSKSKEKLAEVLDSDHKALIKKLESATNNEFDKEYIAIQTNAHKEAVELFSNYSSYGQNQKIKTFAAEMLPMLKDHLEKVQAIEVTD